MNERENEKLKEMKKVTKKLQCNVYIQNALSYEILLSVSNDFAFNSKQDIN